MLLKHRIVSLPSSKKEVRSVSEEDAWLNDVGPQSQSKSYTETRSEVPASSDPKRAVAIEQEPALAQSINSIDIEHRLWPLLMRLSERIWQELQQKLGTSPVPDALQAKFVQQRAIDILRVDSKLAHQVHDVAEAELLLHSLENEVLNYGPLEALMKDDSISEIMVVGPRFACVERNGILEDVPCYFADDRHMIRIIENMLRQAGRHIQPSWPIVDVRLPDGSLVNVVMPPSAVNGPTITIRKGSKKPFTIDDLIQMETLSPAMAAFLRACIEARLNIIICGSVASGRTTLLNALSACIPAHERITTIEEVAELRLSQKHVVSLVSQLAGHPDAGGITVRDLVVNALRSGSERILLGECRGDEVIEMIQAMNNGYAGFLMTLYANDLRNSLTRLEAIYLAGGTALPLSTIKTQIATALDVIIHISRSRDGSRKIVNIAEVQHVEKDVIRLQSIFHFKDSGFEASPGELKSSFEPSGFSPTFLTKIEALNIHLPAEMFKAD